MSVTQVTKRLAYFTDDKGDFVGSCAFDKTAKTFDYNADGVNRTYNISHELATYIIVKRWYHDLHIYIYNINNPDPLIIGKTIKPVLDAEMYNTQIKTTIAKQLNDLSKPPFKLNWIMVAGILVAVAIGVLIMTGTIKLN